MGRELVGWLSWPCDVGGVVGGVVLVKKCSSTPNMVIVDSKI